MKMFDAILKSALAAVLCTVAVHAGETGKSAERSFHLDAGVGIRNISPAVITAGFGYKSAWLRVQGMGYHKDANDFWCGVRGSLLWNFFGNLPFNFDVGIGGGYEYAEAPNGMHKALNEANKGTFVYPYNFKENLDVSLEMWTHLYGFYTQISVPFYQFKDHDVPRVLWGAGYMVEF